jgi:hypothetical protein
MNPNLLCVIPHGTQRPLMLDNVPVSPDPNAGPFLITSSRSLLWVERAFESGFLRVAVRQMGAHDLYGDIIAEIAREGVAREWGNIVEPTPAGVAAGLAHIAYYGLPQPTLLYGTSFDIGLAPEMERVPVSWLPPSWGILVPDREYVGTVYLFGEGHVGAIVHNPSRGVVVLKGKD